MDQRLVKALAHPLRVEILTILNERMASPNELSKELEEGLSQVSYHVKVLKDFECIEMVKTEPRRGAVEHYYRATARAFLTDSDWQVASGFGQAGRKRLGHPDDHRRRCRRAARAARSTRAMIVTSAGLRASSTSRAGTNRSTSSTRRSIA